MKKVIVLFSLVLFSVFAFAQADRNNSEAEQPASGIRFINAQEVTVSFENGNFESKFDMIYCKNQSSNYFGIMFIILNGEKKMKEVEIPYRTVKKVEGTIY